MQSGSSNRVAETDTTQKNPKRRSYWMACDVPNCTLSCTYNEQCEDYTVHALCMSGRMQ
jgi:hypothetical protein